MTHEEVTFYGPRGTIVRSALLDTGAAEAILARADAEHIGLKPVGIVQVQTDNGPAQWEYGEGHLAVGDLGPIRTTIWIAPNGIETTLGEHTLSALGYQILRPPSPSARAAQEISAPSPGILNDLLPPYYHANLSVCRTCPNLGPGPLSSETCGICHCPVKGRALSNSCPIGKFGSY